MYTLKVVIPEPQENSRKTKQLRDRKMNTQPSSPIKHMGRIPGMSFLRYLYIRQDFMDIYLHLTANPLETQRLNSNTKAKQKVIAFLVTRLLCMVVCYLQENRSQDLPV